MIGKKFRILREYEHLGQHIRAGDIFTCVAYYEDGRIVLDRGQDKGFYIIWDCQLGLEAEII